MEETLSTARVQEGCYRSALNAVKANAFFRGVVGSFALISLFAEAVSLENYEVARAINAIVVGWDHIARWIGNAIGWLPFVPELDATFVNILAFLVSVTIPALFGILELVRPLWGNRHQQAWLVTMVLPAGMFICLSFLFVCGPLLFFSGNLEFLKQSVHEGLPQNPFMMVASQAHYLSYLLMSLVMPFVVALLLKAYRFGVLMTAGIIFTVQALYFAPVVGDWVRLFSEAMHGAA